jgi:predicted ATPase
MAPLGAAPTRELVGHLTRDIRDFADPLRAEIAARSAGIPLFVEEIDGAPVDESALAEPLRAAGFIRTPRGYLLRSA